MAMAGAAQATIADAVDAYQRGDYPAALAACKAQAEQGNASCQNLLGILYQEGHGVKANDAEAAKWFRLAADQGHGYAALNLGFCFEKGRGVPQSNADAARWYHRAADQHIPEAEFALGLLALRVVHDEREALKWFRLAAHKGLPLAQYAMGAAYEAGAGTRRNEKQAGKWYLQAAEHGQSAAQSAIARFYEHGLGGIAEDQAEAYFWYAVAARNPHATDRDRKEAKDGLTRLAVRVPSTDRARAEKAAQDFQPTEVADSDDRRHRQTKSAESEHSSGPRLYATGSGFYVTTAGHIVSNNHVVAGCTEVRVTAGEKGEPVKVLATDPDRDLAILQLPHSVAAAVSFRDGGPHLGENVIVMGFPLSGLITSDAVVTTGIVSALAGLRDDRHELQISAPVQPGNSGGPLLDASGRLIGVVVAKLNGLRVAELTGAIPENVNFAIKGEEAQAFLKAHNVAFALSGSGANSGTEAIADQALKYTVRLECWK
jgi:TPR repeat protein